MLARIKFLRSELARHNYLYYIENSPRISDMEFDGLMRELEELEREYPEAYDPNSPTQRVGSDATNRFATVVHRWPMLSLANTYSIDEVGEFCRRVEAARA